MRLSTHCDACATVLRLHRITRSTATTVACPAAPCRTPGPHAASVKLPVARNAVRPDPNPASHVRRLERQHPPGHARVTDRAPRAFAVVGKVRIGTTVLAARLAVDVADARVVPRTRARRHCKGDSGWPWYHKWAVFFGSFWYSYSKTHTHAMDASTYNYCPTAKKIYKPVAGPQIAGAEVARRSCAAYAA